MTRLPRAVRTSGGTAYSSGIANLDPNDIVSINILKGSSAAALYGSRASNGVDSHYDQTGSAGRSRKGSEVTYTSSFSLEKYCQPAGLPECLWYGSQFLAFTCFQRFLGAPFGSTNTLGLDSVVILLPTRMLTLNCSQLRPRSLPGLSQ